MFEQAKWISSEKDMGEISPEFRKNLTFDTIPTKAIAHVTAMGVYELRINGKRIGDAVMTPGWTSYPNRVQYQSYDVTKELTKETRVSILGGKGWALSYLGYQDMNKVFSDRIAVRFQLELTYRDGRTETVVSDPKWEVWTTPILDSEIYHGETVDLTAECRYVGPAEEKSDVSALVVPQVGEFVREQERVCAKELIITPKGERVIDFGQNLAGYVEIRVKGQRGDRIVLTHAEVLDKEGNFYTDNYRTARNRNVYVLSGGEDVFKPSFCFQGYRYIRLDEYPFEEIDLSSFTSVAIYSDMKRIGYFHCGDDRINQLYSNILWGQRSNFIDVPTDCPQRDERLGWTGDAQVFCRTASINYHTERFFKKWLGDMMLEQTEEGGIYGIVPVVGRLTTRISAAWGDASTVCPWEIYQAYGNRELLRTHFDMMKKWVEYMHHYGDEEYLWIGEPYHYGDWLSMDTTENDVAAKRGGTQLDLVATAFFAYSTELVIKAGRVLGEDVSYFEKMYMEIKKAFRAAFMKDGMSVIYPKADGIHHKRPIHDVTQTSLTLILRFGLCEDHEKQGIADRLAQMIRENGNRMTTGFVGTPYLLHVLSDNGYADVAYDLLLQEKAPSWLFSVLHGATTMWEHWDSLREDGTFWLTEMNSFNHYAYGAVCDWLFGAAAGIKVLDDGAAYTHVSIEPHPDVRLGHLSFSIETDRGTLSSGWRYNGEELRYDLRIPQGTVAEVKLPNGKIQTLVAGSYLFVEKC